jgi:hypothetical protein
MSTFINTWHVSNSTCCRLTTFEPYKVPVNIIISFPDRSHCLCLPHSTEADAPLIEKLPIRNRNTEIKRLAVLSVIYGLFDDTVSTSNYVASNDGKVSEQRTGKDTEGSDRVLPV